MRYWRDRDISDRLISDRQARKDARNRTNGTQLAGGVGFQWFNEDEDDD